MIGIICPLWAEAKPLLSWHPQPKKYKVQEYSWIEMTWQHHPLVIVISKVGQTHAAQATELLIEQHAPRVIINFGSAGAIGPEMQIGEVVIATATAEYKQPPPASLLSPIDPELLTIARAIPQIRTGPIVSADQNIESEAMKQDLFERYQALCGDWESAVVMRVCRENHIPSLAFRVVTDWGDEHASSDFQKHHVTVLSQATPLLEQFLRLWSRVG